ncbi:MAG: aconitase X catalytic domain-containing protein [Pseudomonadota bacterium]
MVGTDKKSRWLDASLRSDARPPDPILTRATTVREPLHLTDDERAMQAGDLGPALRFAMDLVVRAAELLDAPRLIDATFLHIDACHYYGTAHLDFANTLLNDGARFEIAAWTNTVPVSLIQDDPRQGSDPVFLEEARALTRVYEKLGARPVWTCAPYQLPDGPERDDQIIVGESNAVSYYNSVVGARTNKYGDFLDVACGLVQRVPFAGLHTHAGRRGEIVLDVAHLPEELRRTEFFCHVLGIVMGRHAENKIPVIVGLPPDTPPDSLKAISAAGASSGGVALFHAVGVTPEAPTLAAALHDREPEMTIRVSPDTLIAARDALSTARDGPLAMVALGTPHFSYTEFARLVALLDGRKIHDNLALMISTSRHVAALIEEHGWLTSLEAAGATILVDTCTYFSPTIRQASGRVMTNSAKWAYYAPGMLPVEVVFASLEDCVASACAGEVCRCDDAWSPSHWGLA